MLNSLGQIPKMLPKKEEKYHQKKQKVKGKNKPLKFKSAQQWIKAKYIPSKTIKRIMIKNSN